MNPWDNRHNIISVEFLPQMQTSIFKKNEKILDKFKLKGTVQNNWLKLFKSIKVMKDK